MELINNTFSIILFFGVLLCVFFAFLAWRTARRPVSKGIDREAVIEVFWEQWAQAQTAQPKPALDDQRVQALLLDALDRLGVLAKVEAPKPQPNGHEPDAEEILSHIVGELRPVTPPAIAAVVAPTVTKVETADLMCKCGDGPFTKGELRAHIGKKVKEKGRHGWPKEKIG